MSNDNETRAGMFSGLLACVMIVALTVMAFATLDTSPSRAAQNGGMSDFTQTR